LALYACFLDDEEPDKDGFDGVDGVVFFGVTCTVFLVSTHTFFTSCES